MIKITFLPSNQAVEVPSGTLISEAAIKAGIEDLHLPCGGKGTCGLCLVEIVEGDVNPIGSTRYDKALSGNKLVMACQTKISSDLTIKITKSREASMRVVGESHMLINQEFLPDEKSISPIYRIVHLNVAEASIEQHYADWQRFERELKAELGDFPVRTDIHVLRHLADAIRKENGKISAIIQEGDCGIKVVHIEAGHIKKRFFGISVDIGTTTVALELVDLSNGSMIASKTSYNAQIRRGADIISRIDYAKNQERLKEMRKLVLETINSLITEITLAADISEDDIMAAFIAGNETMIHLLLALPPQHIRETPYVPTVNGVPGLKASEVGIKINCNSIVEFAPGVGSYVGGDITAGLLCTDIPVDNSGVYLFLDIGTNGEIVLGNADWMVTCACSAGPAFEGSGIDCGMRAAEGAIEYIEILDGGKDVSYDVIGEKKPAGICGSGLICLLGSLFASGVINQMGHFNTELSLERFVKIDNTNGFVLEWGENTASGKDIVITENDIENLIRTKAAIYAACALIMENVGLSWDMISRVFIAGGFGRYLQIEDAVLIGLLPDLEYDKFTYIGNSSLTGSYIALLSREKRMLLSEIANKMTYIDLSSDPKYMDAYIAAMFLPHTDISRFPSVKERIS